jgi:hypothetical protein
MLLDCSVIGREPNAIDVPVPQTAAPGMDDLEPGNYFAEFIDTDLVR